MKVPTPQEFHPSLVNAMQQAVVFLRKESPLMAETLAAQIEHVCADVEATLKERGEQYGEDLLFLTGERGIMIMAVWKSLRMLWSMDTGNPYKDRKDGWRDLAGYAILCMAMVQYAEDWKEDMDKELSPMFHSTAGNTGLVWYSPADEADSAH